LTTLTSIFADDHPGGCSAAPLACEDALS